MSRHVDSLRALIESVEGVRKAAGTAGFNRSLCALYTAAQMARVAMAAPDDDDAYDDESVVDVDRHLMAVRRDMPQLSTWKDHYRKSVSPILQETRKNAVYRIVNSMQVMLMPWG
jgi:hypothetical protein